MMRRCLNPEGRVRPDAEVNALQAYMSRRPLATFEELRAQVSELATLNDGELMQVIQDAGLRHDETL